MTDLVDGKVGQVAYELDFVDGKLKLSGMFDGNGVDVGLTISLEPVVFLDKLKSIIPGSIDDAIIEGIKSAFGMKEPAAAAVEAPKA